jgi:dihydrofolate reductase
MRKLIVWNVVTLDGYFEGTTPWKLDFHETVWGPELEALSKEQLADLDYLLFGRKTYEGMASYWTENADEGEIGKAMNAVPKLVASRRLKSVEWNNSTLIDGDVGDAIRRLKAQDGRNIYVFGSADLLSTLTAEGLVDEYRVCIAPVLLGAGTPLFKPADDKISLKLIDAKALTNGGILMRYRMA